MPHLDHEINTDSRVGFEIDFGTENGIGIKIGTGDGTETGVGTEVIVLDLWVCNLFFSGCTPHHLKNK